MYGTGSHGPRAWCIDLEHLIDGLRAKPRALLHCRYQRHLFPDEHWWNFWQRLLASGDRDGAARLMVEALYVAARVASFELVLAFLQQAQQRQTLSLSLLQQRFRVPPRRIALPDPVIPHICWPPMTTSSPVPRSQAVEAALPLLLKQLKLARFRSHWQPLSQQAEAEGWSPGEFLDALCEQECDHRQVARRQRLLRDAHLPWQKGLDGFDHQHLEPKHWQELQGSPAATPGCCRQRTCCCSAPAAWARPTWPSPSRWR